MRKQSRRKIKLVTYHTLVKSLSSLKDLSRSTYRFLSVLGGGGGENTHTTQCGLVIFFLVEFEAEPSWAKITSF